MSVWTQDPETLRLEITEVKYGMIEFALMLGGRDFAARFSEIWDPIPHFGTG